MKLRIRLRQDNGEMADDVFVVDTFDLFDDKDAMEVDAHLSDEDFNYWFRRLMRLRLTVEFSRLRVQAITDVSDMLNTIKDERRIAYVVNEDDPTKREEAETLISEIDCETMTAAFQMCRYFPEHRRWHWQIAFGIVVRKGSARNSVVLSQTHQGPKSRRLAPKLTPKQKTQKRLAEDRMMHSNLSERAYARKTGTDRNKLRRAMEFYKSLKPDLRGKKVVQKQPP